MSKLPFHKSLLAIAFSTAVTLPLTASACGSQPFLGEICTFGFNFCPVGYLPADGTLLPINQNQALFALLGTIYGGNGFNTFALPDLRGRSPIGVGQGPGLNPFFQGQVGGAETTLLTTANLPSHSHGATTTVTVDTVINASNSNGTTTIPTGKVWANSSSRDNIYGSSQSSLMATGAVTSTATATTTITPTGSGVPVNSRSPFLALSYCIAVQGIFPARQ
jgi:microcystin-dependent protein